jgi:hypothetical protein
MMENSNRWEKISGSLVVEEVGRSEIGEHQTLTASEFQSLKQAQRGSDGMMRA